MFRNKNKLSFRELCLQKSEEYGFLVYLLDVLSTVPLPEKYYNGKIDLDWDTLFASATNALVAPLLYQRIIDNQLSELVPDDFLESLQAVYDLNFQRNFQLKKILEDTLQILNEGGITPTLLKGSHALFGLLPYSSCRMMSDIDLLIPEEQLIEARDLLLANGFYHEGRPNEATDLDRFLTTEHSHIAPLFHPNGYGYLELHRRANYESYHPDLIKHCYSNSSLRKQTIDNCTFYSFSNKHLYLYNQAHHFYERLNVSGFPDLRFAIEQGMLLDGLKSGELLEVHNLIKRLDPNFLTPFFLLNALIRDFFLYPIEDKYCHLDSKNRNNFNDARLLFLGDRQTVWKRQLKVIISVVKYIVVRPFDRSWWRKEKILNMDWYRSRVAALVKLLKDYSMLR